MSENTFIPCVAICVPVYDKISIHFWRSYNQLQKPSSLQPIFGNNGATHTLDVHTFPIVEARTFLTDEALRSEPKVTHLLFVDDDMQFPPHSLKRLLDHDLPIVGGLCHNRRPPYAPVLMKKHEDREGWGFMYHYPKGKLVEVDLTGAGFLLVKREVFEAITVKHGEASWWQKMRGISEDFSFCLRATECGYKVHVDCGLEIGHVGEVVVNAAFAERNRPFQLERWSPRPELKSGSEAVASIIIPAYNQEIKALRAAVFSASYQTVPVEVVVVDDGSEPRIPNERWPENVRLIHHDKNMGIADALNTGIAAMRTDWFCWLSSDDLLDPRKVETQLAYLKDCGGLLSFHRYQVFQDGSEGMALYSQLASWKDINEQMSILSQGCAINGSTVMVHKSIFKQVGTFDPNYRYSQDWEFFCRAGNKHLWYGIEEILGSRRERPANLTNQIAADPAKRARRDVEDNAIRGRWSSR